MTPKEKAEDLINDFSTYSDYNECDVFTEKQNMIKNAINCALICVNEIIELLDDDDCVKEFFYWTDVKKEIDKYQF